MDKIQSEKFDRAVKDIKYVINNQKRTKFKHLDKWVGSLAYYWKNENGKSTNKTFPKYRRGSIILVNFGVGVGDEFSKIHLAVVMDKDDHPRSTTLTVIPLSSKNFGNTISLGTSVYEALATEYLRYLDLIQILYDTFKYGITAISHEKDNKKFLEYVEKTFDTNKRLHELGYTNEDLLKFSNFLLNDNKSETFELNGIEFYSKIRNEVQAISIEFKQLQSKYANHSFAITNKITTISKNRIISTSKKSKYSPIGRAILPDPCLDILDRDIINRFTK